MPTPTTAPRLLVPDSETPLLPSWPEFLRDLGIPAATRLRSVWTAVGDWRLHSRSSIAPQPGIPFVLIHGLVISSLYMIPLAECLALRHSVHALDLPGFGRSAVPREILTVPQLADAVIAWLAASGIDRCHLVANSLGCEIAAHIAVTAPERVASMVLIGPTLDPRAFAVATQTTRLLWDALHEPVRLWMNWIFDFCRAGLRRSFGTTRAMFRDHIERQLPRITAKTLIMRGSNDPTVPQSAAEEMAGLVPASKLLVIADQPHCVHYTRPLEVSVIIEQFTAGNVAGL